VQLTEALAEHWHARVRAELGFADEDARDLSGILKLEHRGARYAWGYPACPDVEEQTKVASLLDWGRIGVELSEEFQLTPSSPRRRSSRTTRRPSTSRRGRSRPGHPASRCKGRDACATSRWSAVSCGSSRTPRGR
jgi:5-methyltetrahydrofolate--homocysteine methyltransferase